MPKVLLLDIDGVLLQPEDVFSRIYAKQNNLDVTKFPKFFKGEFQKALVGEADLKELILKHNDTWNWDKDVDDLLKLWFETETVINEKLLSYVTNLDKKNLIICVATNQEKYRGKYLREKVFPGLFDNYYISAEMHFFKPQPEFFNYIIDNLTDEHESVMPGDILYFDDSLEHVDSAKKLGINAHLYTSNDQAINEIKKLSL